MEDIRTYGNAVNELLQELRARETKTGKLYGVTCRTKVKSQKFDDATIVGFLKRNEGYFTELMTY